MDAHRTRKVKCEKVRLDATLGDCNLRIPQGRMCQKEIYETLEQEFSGSH